MQASEVAYVLNNTIFRPGWKVRARVGGYQDSLVTLTLAMENMIDTSFPGADGTYTVPRHAGGQDETSDFELFPSDFTTVPELLYHVLQLINALQEHEDREFLRVKVAGKYVAPFHPHTRAGNLAWDRTGEVDTTEKLVRLQLGAGGYKRAA